MTVFLCPRCGVRITPDLVELPAVPNPPAEEDRDPRTLLAPSTVPRGHYAAEPGRMFRERAFAAPGDPRSSIVIHPEDAPELRSPPDGRSGLGCCGPSGDRGANRACSCGNRVATLVADCLGPYELRLDPVRVFAFDQG
ncbi:MULTISPECIES: hypothetical protein [Nocardiopsis]|uniref:Uncharacterized protein n=1 Tax=Nocardiopsis sinuspersici TaxID=501010 RepID=A0A1V3C573_9ACTN|nr:MULTISPECIES: hypothetical protein [Nocardiopsis]OOC55954.1 hypothetical protein NOSIN_20695 [Nocardiopsis sinuspersici]